MKSEFAKVGDLLVDFNNEDGSLSLHVSDSEGTPLYEIAVIQTERDMRTHLKTAVLDVSKLIATIEQVRAKALQAGEAAGRVKERTAIRYGFRACFGPIDEEIGFQVASSLKK